jgi:hypothetical protein
MASKPTKVNPSSGFIALLTVILTLICGYTVYLIEAGRALDFQAEMLGPSQFIVKPAFVIETISKGGFIGTATAVALKVLHAMLAVAIAFTVATIALPFLLRKDTKSVSKSDPETEVRQHVFEASIKGSEMLVFIPDNTDPVTGAKVPGISDNNPYQQAFFRIDSKPVRLAREPQTPIEHLQREVLEILAAHPDVPASVGNHHADATLQAHSIDVAKKVKSVMDRLGRADPLTTVVGLAHDLDKLLAYQRKGDSWVKNKSATHHNTYSAYIACGLPSFQSLSDSDRNVLVLVLRYYHHPNQLPLNAGERVEHLIQAIREADGWGLRDERANAISTAKENPNTVNFLCDGITQFLADADVNRYKGGSLADGWTVNAVEYVIVPASTILERLEKYIPQQLSQQLQLNVETRVFGHPAIEVIRETLRGMGLLIEEYKEIVSPTSLFDVKVGRQRFSACFLLDKNNLQDLLPTTVPKWGMSEYGLRIRGATKPTLEAADEDDE